MKKIKRLLLLLLVAAFTICTPLSAYAADTETKSDESETAEQKKQAGKNGDISTDDFKIKVTCGLQGNYKFGAAIPVNVKINSLNADFEGTVRVIVPGSEWYSAEAVAYDKDVLLSQGSEKTVTLSIYNNTVATNLVFQLIDSKGKKIIDQSIKLASKAGENALVGVLSDDYTALNYFDKRSLDTEFYQGQTQLIELSEEIIPQNASGLECLSYIIINSYDSSKLNDDQLDSIKKWVEQGGVLIIGGGSDYKTTMSGFSDVLSVKEEEKSQGQLAVYYKEKEDEEPVDYTNNDGILKLSVNGATDLNNVLTDSSLIKDLGYKSGHIILTGFNLGMEPLISHANLGDFAVNLLAKSANGYSAKRLGTLNYGSYMDAWSIYNLLNGIMQDQYPHVPAIMIILFIFVLLGPVMYLILKKIDKRELLWFIIPAASIVFTMLIFVANADIRIKHPIVTSMTTIFEDNTGGEKSMSASTTLGILVPTTRHTEVNMDKSLVNLKLFNNNDGYYDSNATNAKWNTDYTQAIKETADGYNLSFDNRGTFETDYMGFDYTGQYDAGDGLEVDVRRKVTGISGKITNNTGYNLTSVGLFTYGRMVIVGGLKNGESVDFTEADNTANFEWDFYGIKIPGVETDSKEYNQIVAAFNMAYQAYMVNDIEVDRANVYTLGCIEDWTSDYVTDSKVKEFSRAIYISKKTVGYEDYENAEISNLFTFSEQTKDWDTYDGQLYATDVEALFDLSNSYNQVYALIRAKDSERKYGNTKGTQIFAYNNSTEQYEELFVDGVIEKFDKGCPYLSEEGLLKLKFTCKNTYDYVPYLTLVGGWE